MPYKDPEVRKRKHAEYSKKYYEANKPTEKIRLLHNKKQKKVEWDVYKATLKCINCGENHPATFDFHHVNPEEKKYSVNDLVSNKRWARVYEEIKKCIVLCANCHRKHHYEEDQQKKKAKKKPRLVSGV